MSDLTHLPSAFHFLTDLGFEVESGHADEREFGNAVLVLKRNDELALRFVRDRGDIFIDVRSAGTGWYKLEDVMQFIEGSGLPRGLDTQKLAELLRSRLEEVGRMLQDEVALARFTAFSKQRSESLINKIFPGQSKD